MEGERKWAWALILVWMVSVAAVAEGNTGAGYYDLAVFSFQAGDYAGAEQLLKKALNENSGDAYVHYYLGKATLKQERLSEAEGFFQEARRLDAGIPGLAYDMGTLYQKKKDYSRAVTEFEAVPAEDSSHVLALYHAGTGYFMLEQYGKALDFFVRSAALSPSIKPNAYFYAGICHYHLSEMDQALSKFDETAATADTESMRADARRWAADIRARQGREKPLRLYARAGYLYDDNVQLAPLDSDTFTGEGDQAAVLYFSGQYAHPVGDQLDVGVGYSHYQTEYRDFDAYNLTGGIGEIFTRYHLSQVTLGLSYVPAYYWVDADSYLMQHQLRPEVRWRLTEADEAVLSYGYSRNNYFTDQRRDGHANEINLNLFHEVKPLDGFLYCGGGYEDNTASHPDEYFTETTGRVGISSGIFQKVRAGVSGEINGKNYDNRDSVYHVTREDSRYAISALVSWNPFVDWLGIAAEYTYSRNNSNIADYDYKRNTTAMYVTADF
ncbi:MAG: tetratricopeptide repeat protein [Desulfosalsimonadaceae bacterium]|nr:tetratricopeptide repeat protein [Desulfosalsimonadaceae bacterium]